MMMCAKSENMEQHQLEKKARPADEQALKCPRCDSSNTKFCYYNNYSLTQPRYFCKSCRRYWTKGGTLRNVPVGGGCRKNRRSSSSSSAKRPTPDHHLQFHGLITTPTSSSSSSSQNLMINSYDHHHGNISILGNSYFDIFGNPCGNNSSVLDTLRSNIIENNHLYYGVTNLGNVENGGMMHFDDYNHNNGVEIMSNASSGSSTPTTIKQELGENRSMLWGFPWQMNGEGNYMNNINGMESIKESWNSAIVGPSWNNLLNSPLM